MRYERSLAIAGRHEKLIELIRSGDYSTPGLAQKLGVSEQTIYRDIFFLKQHGYTIRSVKRPTSWAYQLQAEPAKVSNGRESSRT